MISHFLKLSNDSIFHFSVFRLTSLVFREECIVTACQDGYVCTWARPGRGSVSQGPLVTALGGPPPPGAGELVSPTQSNQVKMSPSLF